MKKYLFLSLFPMLSLFAVELQPLELPEASGPMIPWVAAEDGSWKSAEPLAALGEGPFAAELRAAVSAENLLIHVTVRDAQHENTQGGDKLWKGDCVQLAVDSLGNGAPPIGVANQWEIDTDDADFGFSLNSNDGSVNGWSWYHGQMGRGQHPKDELAEITRDEAAGVTVYDIAIPWSEFGVKGGVSSQIGLSLKVNNSSGEDKGELSFGGGAGGTFAASRLESLDVAEPHNLDALCVPFSAVQADQAIELRGLCSDAAELRVQVGEQVQSVPLSVGRFRVRVVLDELPKGLLPLSAELVRGGAVLSETSVNLYDDTTEQWFTFETDQRDLIGKVEYLETPISLSSWVEAPAGEKGRPMMKGDRFVLRDGSPIKFWGVNQSYGKQCAPPKSEAERWVQTWNKYGINLVRMHKFANHSNNGLSGGHEGEVFNDRLLDQFDYYMAQLSEKGVYYSFSPFFGFWLGTQQIAELKYPEYFEGKKRKHTSCISLINIAPDIQDQVIGWMVSLMKHENPYTGKTYAEDPALVWFELQNEDDLFWFPTDNAIYKYPKYGRDFCGRFSDWLKKKYGSHEALVAAWGETVLSNREKKTGYWFKQQKLFDEDEHLDQRNIVCICSPWFMSPDGLVDQQANPAIRGKQRLLDNAQFLLETQQAYYGKYRDALREAGYDGPLVASCWQAGEGMPHYLNLLTDYEIGLIDRHNYYGGRPGFAIRPGFVSNIPMLAQPGLGLLSSGMQQVADRPFSFSEWNGRVPYQWRQEAPIIIAAYGMGLQGWDSSNQFDMPDGYFDDTWDNTFAIGTPDALGLYPVLARMVHRGDIQESEPVSVRNVCVPDLLQTGTLNFEERVLQAGDEKSFTGRQAPHQALTVGRTIVQFTDTPQPTETFDSEAHKEDGAYVSVTGQLRWKATGPGGGYIVIDSDGTQGVVGFLPNEPFELGDVAITPNSFFCSVLMTAIEKEETLNDCKRALLQVMGRVAQSGEEFNRSNTVFAETGNAPFVIEPVFATVQLARPDAEVYVLDHDGLRTGEQVDVLNGSFTIDGTRDKALYYEVVYK
jgi:hypothetical protein